MAQDVEARHLLGFEQPEHVRRHRPRLVSVEGLVAVGESPQVWSHEREPVGEPIDDGKEFAVILRPAMHTQDGRAAAGGDVMQRDAVRLGALVGQGDSALRRWRGARLLYARRAFIRGLGQRGSGWRKRRRGDGRSDGFHGAAPGQIIRGRL
jgi:hypothetical protein